MVGLMNYPQVSGWDQQLQQLGLTGVSPFNVQNQMNPTQLPETPAKKVIQDTVDPNNKIRGERDVQGGPSVDRNDPMKNYGYVSKPGWMDYASFLPGIPGLAAKAVNAGINMNNTEAVGTARNMLGLEDKNSGFMGTVHGALKDNKGQVADVSIGDSTQGPTPDYSVGFEAMSPEGRTNLTPTEANTRANLLGGLKEIDRRPAETTDRHTSFINDARNFFDSLFDGGDSGSNDLSGPQTTNVTPTARPDNGGHNPGNYSGSYSGLGGDDSPSEGGGRFGGSGLGTPDKDKSK